MANLKTLYLVLFGVLLAVSTRAFRRQWGIPSLTSFDTGAYGNNYALSSNNAGQTFASNAVAYPALGLGYGYPYGYADPLLSVPMTQGVYYSNQQADAAVSTSEVGSTQSFSSINDGLGGSTVTYADAAINNQNAAVSSVGNTDYTDFSSGPLGASQTVANTNYNNAAAVGSNNAAFNNFNSYIAPALGYYPGLAYPGYGYPIW